MKVAGLTVLANVRTRGSSSLLTLVGGKTHHRTLVTDDLADRDPHVPTMWVTPVIRGTSTVHRVMALPASVVVG